MNLLAKHFFDYQSFVNLPHKAIQLHKTPPSQAGVDPSAQWAPKSMHIAGKNQPAPAARANRNHVESRSGSHRHGRPTKLEFRHWGERHGELHAEKIVPHKDAWMRTLKGDFKHFADSDDEEDGPRRALAGRMVSGNGGGGVGAINAVHRRHNHQHRRRHSSVYPTFAQHCVEVGDVEMLVIFTLNSRADLLTATIKTIRGFTMAKRRLRIRVQLFDGGQMVEELRLGCGGTSNESVASDAEAADIVDEADGRRERYTRRRRSTRMSALKRKDISPPKAHRVPTSTWNYVSHNGGPAGAAADTTTVRHSSVVEVTAVAEHQAELPPPPPDGAEDFVGGSLVLESDCGVRFTSVHGVSRAESLPDRRCHHHHRRRSSPPFSDTHTTTGATTRTTSTTTILYDAVTAAAAADAAIYQRRRRRFDSAAAAVNSSTTIDVSESFMLRVPPKRIQHCHVLIQIYAVISPPQEPPSTPPFQLSNGASPCCQHHQQHNDLSATFPTTVHNNGPAAVDTASERDIESISVATSLIMASALAAEAIDAAAVIASGSIETYGSQEEERAKRLSASASDEQFVDFTSADDRQSPTVECQPDEVCYGGTTTDEIGTEDVPTTQTEIPRPAIMKTGNGKVIGGRGPKALAENNFGARTSAIFGLCDDGVEPVFDRLDAADCSCDCTSPAAIQPQSDDDNNQDEDGREVVWHTVLVGGFVVGPLGSSRGRWHWRQMARKRGYPICAWHPLIRPAVSPMLPTLPPDRSCYTNEFCDIRPSPQRQYACEPAIGGSAPPRSTPTTRSAHDVLESAAPLRIDTAQMSEKFAPPPPLPLRHTRARSRTALSGGARFRRASARPHRPERPLHIRSRSPSSRPHSPSYINR